MSNRESRKTSKVIFRKVKGRIIPIRVREGAPKIVQGFATAAAAGSLSAAILRGPDYVARFSRRLAVNGYIKTKHSGKGMPTKIADAMQMGFDAKKKLGKSRKPPRFTMSQRLRLGENAKRFSHKLIPYARPVFLAGALYGSYKVAEGTQDIIGRKNKKTAGIASSVGGATALSVASASFLGTGGHNWKKALQVSSFMMAGGVRRILFR